jgi:hypothetical protein
MLKHLCFYLNKQSNDEIVRKCFAINFRLKHISLNIYLLLIAF